MSEHEGPWSRPAPPAGPRPAPAPRAGFSWRTVAWIGVIAALLGLLWVLNETFPNQVKGSNGAYLWLNLGYLTLLAGGVVRMRGMGLGVAARNIAIWMAIIGVLAVGYAYRGEFGDVRDRLAADFSPGGATLSPHTLVLTAGEGGGFRVLGAVNGQPAPFAIDTGASDIVLSPDLARRLGVDVDHLTYGQRSETANGEGRGAATHVASLSVGPIHLTNVPVIVNQTPMSESLLGMTFLRRLDGFEVRGDRMTLRWRGQ